MVVNVNLALPLSLQSERCRRSYSIDSFSFVCLEIISFEGDFAVRQCIETGLVTRSTDHAKPCPLYYDQSSTENRSSIRCCLFFTAFTLGSQTLSLYANVIISDRTDPYFTLRSFDFDQQSQPMAKRTKKVGIVGKYGTR